MIREVYEVARACGVRISGTTDGHGRPFHSFMLRDSATHVSSTVEDLREGKRTEIDFLKGNRTTRAGIRDYRAAQSSRLQGTGVKLL